MTPPSPPAPHSTGTDKLLVEVAGAVAIVTFNNPARRNALSSEMRAALPGLLEALKADGDVRVVVSPAPGTRRSPRAPTSPSSATSAPRPPPAPTTTAARPRSPLAWAIWTSPSSP